jgi:membrane protease YdiL (CAAX protease family)
MKKYFYLAFIVFALYIITNRCIIFPFFNDYQMFITISKTFWVIVLLFYLIRWKRFSFKFITTDLFWAMCLMFPAIYLSFDFIQKEGLKHSISLKENIEFLIFCISTGFFEEVLFRGVLTFGLIEHYKCNPKKKYQIVFITSILFGIVHTVNMINTLYHPLSVLSQVYFAFFMGLLLHSLFFRYGNILIPITVHSLINYLGSYQSQLFNIESETSSSHFEDMLSSLATFSSIGFIFILPAMYLLLSQTSELQFFKNYPTQ